MFISLAVICTSFSFSGQCVSYETNSNFTSSVYYDRLNEVALTGDPRVDIVNVALSQFGYSEGNSSKNLAGTSIGVNNYTEYGNWYGLQGMWCAMFVSWCADTAGIPTSVVPPHAYTASGLLWFMDREQTYSRKDVESGAYIPLTGDIIYFRSDRNNSIVNHVGIVIGYFDGYVYTIEGNVNFDPYCTDGGQVLLRSRHISDPYIRYFCSPAYSTDVTHEIGNFFPSGEERPDAPEAEIILGEVEESYVDAPDAVYASDSPSYNFIP